MTYTGRSLDEDVETEGLEEGRRMTTHAPEPAATGHPRPHVPRDPPPKRRCTR